MLNAVYTVRHIMNHFGTSKKEDSKSTLHSPQEKNLESQQRAGRGGRGYFACRPDFGILSQPVGLLQAAKIASKAHTGNVCKVQYYYYNYWHELRSVFGRFLPSPAITQVFPLHAGSNLHDEACSIAMEGLLQAKQNTVASLLFTRY